MWKCVVGVAAVVGVGDGVVGVTGVVGIGVVVFAAVGDDVGASGNAVFHVLCT